MYIYKDNSYTTDNNTLGDLGTYYCIAEKSLDAVAVILMVLTGLQLYIYFDLHKRFGQDYRFYIHIVNFGCLINMFVHYSFITGL